MKRREFVAASTSLGALTLLGKGVHASTQRAELAAIENDRLVLNPMQSDQWELLFKLERPLRLLQVTDTHFGSNEAKDKRSFEELPKLIDQTDPDLIIHTGDFVNNDSKSKVNWRGVEFFNGLGRPWTLCFGNHDYPVHNAEGSLSLEDYRGSLTMNGMGYFDSPTSRHYCYRYDVKRPNSRPLASLFFFQVGYAEGDRKISEPQLAWFKQQIESDKAQQTATPILVFVHIPLIEYDKLAQSGRMVGEKHEAVCFDSDTGGSFELFAASGRVKGVFCGHDHVNNYFGDWQGIQLHYGRISGWGGYGDWARGGRLISLDLNNGRFEQREVLA